MDKLQKLKSLVQKWGISSEDKVQAQMPRNATTFNRVLLHISREAYNLGVQSIQDSHLGKDNHKIGIELESYCEVLFYRGFQKEHDQLLEIASKLK